MHTHTVAEVQETAFERPRGISRVQIRQGYALVHISQMHAPLMDARLALIEAIAKAGISIDFLKLTQTGLSFLVPEALAEKVDTTLQGLAPRHTVSKDHAIVLVHAVNMRDEEGLLAKVVALAIRSGVPIDNLGDMHDQVLIVTKTEGAEKIAREIQGLVEANREG